LAKEFNFFDHLIDKLCQMKSRSSCVGGAPSLQSVIEPNRQWLASQPHGQPVGKSVGQPRQPVSNPKVDARQSQKLIPGIHNGIAVKSPFPLPLTYSMAPTAEPNCSSKNLGWSARQPHLAPWSVTVLPLVKIVLLRRVRRAFACVWV